MRQVSLVGCPGPVEGDIHRRNGVEGVMQIYNDDPDVIGELSETHAGLGEAGP